MTPDPGMSPRPESSKLLIAAMTVVWALCLAFSLICYFLFQIEYHGFITPRRGPVDPVWIGLTVTGMIAGVAAAAAASYAALRSWKRVAVAAVLGAVVCAVVVPALLYTVLGAS